MATDLTSFTTIKAEQRGAVVWIWLDRPDKYHAFNKVMCDELAGLWKVLKTDDSVRSVVLTATGGLSRNRKVGLLLAAGQTLPQAVDSLGHVAEGVYCARTVVQRAGVLGVEMPISEAVVALLDGRTTPGQAVQALMGRDPVAEGL